MAISYKDIIKQVDTACVPSFDIPHYKNYFFGVDLAQSKDITVYWMPKNVSKSPKS